MDARHFATSCLQLLSPISSSSLSLSKKIRVSQTSTDAVSQRSQYFSNIFPQKKIIYAYNNTATDAIKTLAAFGKSLSQNQYLRDTLVLMQFCSKNVPASELLGVNEIVRQTNQLFGTVDSVPVHFYHQNLDKDEEKAIMMASTLAVFLGLDPLSLEKAKAYILCQHVSPASLIVSENSKLGIPYGPLTVTNNLNAVSHLADCFQRIFTTMGAPEMLQRYEVKKDKQNRQSYFTEN